MLFWEALDTPTTRNNIESKDEFRNFARYSTIINGHHTHTSMKNNDAREQDCVIPESVCACVDTPTTDRDHSSQSALRGWLTRMQEHPPKKTNHITTTADPPQWGASVGGE